MREMLGGEVLPDLFPNPDLDGSDMYGCECNQDRADHLGRYALLRAVRLIVLGMCVMGGAVLMLSVLGVLGR